MRFAPLRFERTAFFIRKLQARPVIDRRHPPRELAFALAVEFVGRLIAGIKLPALFQPGHDLVVSLRPHGLAFLTVPAKPQPAQVSTDCLDELLARTLGVGVVEPQDELPPGLVGKKPVEDCGADVADMKSPGRARRKAN